MKLKTVFYSILALSLLVACVGGDPAAEDGNEVGAYDAVDLMSPFWPALAMLETGENPLWFELTHNGPALIDSPWTASAAPITPWPHARFIPSFMPWQDSIVMAVNLDGFLVLGPAMESAAEQEGRTRTVLYRISDPEYWAPFTIGSFFLWRNQPSALLYRNNFFTDLHPYSPQIPVFTLNESSAVPLGVEVPALKRFPPGNNWETETLWRGHSGQWYYRMREKGGRQHRIAYFRTYDLEQAGERVTQTAWRNSNLPESADNMPALLADAVADARRFGLFDGENMYAQAPFLIRVQSTDFDGTRSFRSAGTDSPAGAQVANLLGFYNGYAAVLLFPDGRGLYSGESGAKTFSLPALPDSFIYTGIALFGDIVFAVWEEQRGAGIGAAGFMVRNAFF